MNENEFVVFTDNKIKGQHKRTVSSTADNKVKVMTLTQKYGTKN
jgi:hypothetical protein